MSGWWRRLAAALARLGRPDAGDEATRQPMKLVVGLGNHGREYIGTRHNVGYVVVDRLAEKFGPVRFRRQFEGKLASVSVANEKVVLLKPETYMNLSGRSVQPAVRFYAVELPDLLVVCDDLNLPVGKIRIRRSGSDGGQKGLRSIAQQLGTTDYPRLRIGIGSRGQREAADYVLSRFAADEREAMNEVIERAVTAVSLWCEAGLDECMNRFN